MNFEESEYRKAFMFQKRWAKHWLTQSAHRNHSSTIGMIEPARETLEFIDKISNNKESSYKNKCELLNSFLEKHELLSEN